MLAIFNLADHVGFRSVFEFSSWNNCILRRARVWVAAKQNTCYKTRPQGSGTFTRLSHDHQSAADNRFFSERYWAYSARASSTTTGVVKGMQTNYHCWRRATEAHETCSSQPNGTTWVYSCSCGFWIEPAISSCFTFQFHGQGLFQTKKMSWLKRTILAFHSGCRRLGKSAQPPHEVQVGNACGDLLVIDADGGWLARGYTGQKCI